MLNFLRSVHYSLLNFHVWEIGTMWTASAHIITAVIGSGVLSLAWAIGQLGWIAGPAVMILFSFVTYYTSTLLSACYRTGDPVNGKRNYTYMDAVHSIIGKFFSYLANPVKQIMVYCNSLVKHLGGLSDFQCFNFLFSGYVFPGGSKVKLCGLVQYVNLFGVAIGYTIASSISMM